MSIPSPAYFVAKGKEHEYHIERCKYNEGHNFFPDLTFSISEYEQTEYGTRTIETTLKINSVKFFKTSNYIDEINDFIEKNYSKATGFTISYNYIKDHILYSSKIKKHIEGLEAYRKHKESQQSDEQQ